MSNGNSRSEQNVTAASMEPPDHPWNQNPPVRYKSLKTTASGLFQGESRVPKPKQEFGHELITYLSVPMPTCKNLYS